MTFVKPQAEDGRAGAGISRRQFTTASLAVTGLLGPLDLLAQAPEAYPSKPIHFVVGYTPGGPNDTLARLFATRLKDRLGQPIVIDNKPGAGSLIGGEFTARAAPDGYTFFVAPGGHPLFSALYPKMRYDPLKDLTGVSQFVRLSQVLVASAEFPIRNVKDIVEFGKKNPDKLTLATSGTGSLAHLSGELLGRSLGVPITHVPYKGVAPALADVIGGHATLMFDSYQALLPHIRSGKLHVIGYAGKKRWPQAPEVPTLIEQGVPGFAVETFIGLVAPAKTPRPILERVARELDAIRREPEVKELLLSYGMEAADGSIDDFNRFMNEENVRWSKIIRELDIKMDA